MYRGVSRTRVAERTRQASSMGDRVPRPESQRIAEEAQAGRRLAPRLVSHLPDGRRRRADGRASGRERRCATGALFGPDAAAGPSDMPGLGRWRLEREVGERRRPGDVAPRRSVRPVLLLVRARLDRQARWLPGDCRADRSRRSPVGRRVRVGSQQVAGRRRRRTRDRRRSSRGRDAFRRRRAVPARLGGLDGDDLADLELGVPALNDRHGTDLDLDRRELDDRLVAQDDLRTVSRADRARDAPCR